MSRRSNIVCVHWILISIVAILQPTRGIFTSSQANICLDKVTVCNLDEMCVSWERGCSIGAVCLSPGIFDVHMECKKLSDLDLPMFPSKELCRKDEIFARGTDKLCRRFPCPLRFGFNCYPKKYPAPTCEDVKCPYGSYCYIGESCGDIYCQPDAMCRVA